MHYFDDRHHTIFLVQFCLILDGETWQDVGDRSIRSLYSSLHRFRQGDVIETRHQWQRRQVRDIERQR